LGQDNTSPHLVVAGAGIVGLSCAWAVQRRGWRVTLIDRDFNGEPASHGNAGSLAVAECVPLSLAGLGFKPLQWLLDPLGPLAIRPAHALRLWPWYQALRKVAQPETFERIGDALAALNQRALHDFETILADLGLSAQLHRCGALTVYETRQAFEQSQSAWQFKRARGVRWRNVAVDELRSLEPGLAPVFEHTVLLQDCAHVSDPKHIVDVLRARVQQWGAELVTGEALALAARERGIGCHVVVPEGAARSKLDAIRAYGATIHRCAPSLAAREAVCAEIQVQTSACLVHPYTHPDVIAGQGTAALELIHACPDLEAVVVPVGGGGLAAGTALVLAELAPEVRLYLAEPAGAADAAESLRTLQHVSEMTPETVCDGLRATLGAPNFEILLRSNAEGLVVEDADTLAAQRLLMTRSKLLVEPSSATVLAAVLAYPERFAGKRVALVLSGGNFDLP